MSNTKPSGGLFGRLVPFPPAVAEQANGTDAKKDEGRRFGDDGWRGLPRSDVEARTVEPSEGNRKERRPYQDIWCGEIGESGIDERNARINKRMCGVEGKSVCCRACVCTADDIIVTRRERCYRNRDNSPNAVQLSRAGSHRPL